MKSRAMLIREAALRHMALTQVRDYGGTSIARLAQAAGSSTDLATRALRELVRAKVLAVAARGAPLSFLPGPNFTEEKTDVSET